MAALSYVVLLGGVTVLGWVPGLADADGRLFGIFRLTWYNDALHLSSAAWALCAAWSGVAAATVFLRTFGALYLLDGLMGLAIGSGYLDAGLLLHGVQDLPLRFKLLANAPHITLGALALLASFDLRRRHVVVAAGLLVFLAPLQSRASCLDHAAGAVAPVSSPVLIADAGYRRPAANSYLSYPEWSIVYAYQDMAGVMAAGGESSFDYLSSIGQFWGGLCRVLGRAAQSGPAPLDETAMLAVIGVSFTAEMVVKGAYETTVGRLTAALRGPAPTREDQFALWMAQDYAGFLQQTPWYEYPFLGRVRQLWSTVPFTRSSPIRATERRVALTLEWGFKSLYGRLIAAGAGLSPADPLIGSVVRGLDAADLAALPEVRLVRPLPGGMSLIETPRYGAYTSIVEALALRGRDLVEIAGNTRVLVTVLVPPGGRIEQPDTVTLFADSLQSRSDWRREGLDVPVAVLADLVRRLHGTGVVFEHVYDY
jgi:hypothetical protein